MGATADHPPAGPADPFRPVWTAYRKAVDHDYFAHRGAGAALHRVLAGEVGRPFRFLDLACGDARTSAAALPDTPVAHYRGVDLSAAALAAAREAVASLPCPAEFEQADFTAAVRDRSRPADVVWIGLSLHHLRTDGKAAFLADVRGLVGPDGWCLVYEPVSAAGESRAAYLDRFEATYRPLWPALAADEWGAVMAHVRAADYPESAAGWAGLGRGAGFARARELFTDPAGLITLFCFGP